MNTPKLTAIGSGKGGTGKTFVATSLASAFALQGERVLLCDADLGLSNSSVHLGLESGGDLAGVLSDRLSLSQAIVPVSGGQRGSFDLIAAPAGSGALANVGQAIAGRLIAKLRAARVYDRILLDLSAGVDATTIQFAALADETLLVLTADPASLTDAYAFAKLQLRLSGAMPLALVNLAESEAEARRTGETLIKTCQAFLKVAPDYLGYVPRDSHAVTAIRRQSPLLTLFPQCPASRAFESLARRLVSCGAPGKAEAGVLKLR